MAALRQISGDSDTAPGNRRGTVNRELLARLACPACSGNDELTGTAEAIRCARCATQFPVYRSGSTNIPWLFGDPENSLLEWKARLNGFFANNWAEQTRLRRAAKGKGLGNLTRRRLSLLLEGRMTQRLQFTELLAPLDFEYTNFDRGSDPASLLRSRAPGQHGLASHYSHIFRDWCWDNGETEEQLEAIRCVLREVGTANLGSILTIGAGACRLPYEIHRRLEPSLSVVMDINPLQLFVASRIIHGQSVTLVEFPAAPISESSFAVNQECFAPESFGDDASFAFVLADAMHPPVKDASFDTVLTPWVIDALPQALRDSALAINRVLPVGGKWINTGSLAFTHREIAQCLSEEETLECVEKSGFEIISTDRRRIPYMQSPHSAHWRHESILSFCARKIRTVEETRHFRHLPEWLLDTSAAIPVLSEFSEASSENLLRAQILAAIDGERSIEAIGAMLAGEYGLRRAEAQNAVRRILLGLFESQFTSSGAADDEPS